MPEVRKEILSWARETAGLSLEDAASKLQISDSKAASAKDKLLAYEEGEKVPSRPLLLRMAKLYRRPLLTFYLEKPPLTGDRGEDFRTLPDQFAAIENAYIDVLIREVKARQSLIRETLIDEEEDVRLKFVGSNSVEQGVAAVVKTLRKAIDLDLDKFRSQPNYGEAFKLLRRRVEDAGVFVLLQGNLGSHHTDIGVGAFRGFALSDDIAPFIVINDLDAKSAWSFTLLHELAHLALGQTGISGARPEKKIEKFCNDVASEMLLPTKEFDGFRLTSHDSEAAAKEISEYAISRKVSSSHIAYRLYLRGDINTSAWKKLSDYFHEQWAAQRMKEKAKARGEEGRGPNYYVVKRYKLGALVPLVQRFLFAGAISTTKAGIVLGVRPLKVDRLFQENQVA